ncbi:uncharacterized protein LOC118190010 [Stegodyphus dumicola]|uniref:uncharacterized protein LOC118190010 n=1 Tax=Stegodyphus dumicola TaxID=202533 RepID=UPI0015AFDD12|nr:uncharacterized protein LOC118190010 [Stegodyphus dumicola]
MGARKIRQLSALQRPFAINLCKAYRTTATNAAQVLAGIIPLHIKALMESAYAQLIHLRRDATFGNTTYSPVQYEHRGDVLRTHPSIKGTGIRTVKSNCLHRDTLTKIYTDGSKHEHGVGSAFIHYDGSNTEYTWKGHLKPENSVFQAEVTALTAAVQHILNNNIQAATIYTDSLSAINAIENQHHVSPSIINLQDILQHNRHTKITMVWVKAHDGNQGNEAADRLAKDAASNLEAQEINIPAPPSYLKRHLQGQAIRQWQEEWTNAETGRRTYERISKVSTDRLIAIAPLVNYITGHGPFPSYFHRHGISNTDICVCGEDGTPDHYLFRCPLTNTMHLFMPTSNITAYHRLIIKHKGSINAICKIIKFIAALGQDICQPI